VVVVIVVVVVVGMEEAVRLILGIISTGS